MHGQKALTSTPMVPTSDARALTADIWQGREGAWGGKHEQDVGKHEQVQPADQARTFRESTRSSIATRLLLPSSPMTMDALPSRVPKSAVESSASTTTTSTFCDAASSSGGMTKYKKGAKSAPSVDAMRTIVWQMYMYMLLSSFSNFPRCRTAGRSSRGGAGVGGGGWGGRSSSYAPVR